MGHPFISLLSGTKRLEICKQLKRFLYAATESLYKFCSITTGVPVRPLRDLITPWLI